MLNDAVAVGPFLLRCFYEAQDVQSCGEVFGQYRVKFDSYFCNFQIMISMLLATVYTHAVILGFLEITREILEMLGHGMKSVDYGGGSIEELDLRESKGIMNEGEHLLQLPPEILKHIKDLNLIESM